MSMPFLVDTGEANTLAAATAKTAITLVAPTNAPVIMDGVFIWGKDTVATDTPIKVELMTFTSLTGGTAGTVVKTLDDGDEAESLQSTIAGNYSAEPSYTGATTFQTCECHPQGSIYVPLNRKIKGGTGFAVRLTAAQAQSGGVPVQIHGTE